MQGMKHVFHYWKMCGHLSLNVSSSGDKFENTAATINFCWSCDTVQNINTLTYWRVVVKGTAWICSVSTFTKLLAVLAKRFLLQRRFLSEGRWLNTAQLLFNTRDRGSAYTSQVLRPVYYIIYIYRKQCRNCMARYGRAIPFLRISGRRVSRNLRDHRKLFIGKEGP